MGYYYICYTLSPGSFALWHHSAAKTLGEVEKDLAVNMGLFHSGIRGACGPKQFGLTWQSGLAFARLVSLEAMLSGVLSGPLTASFLCATTWAYVPGVALSRHESRQWLVQWSALLRHGYKVVSQKMLCCFEQQCDSQFPFLFLEHNSHTWSNRRLFLLFTEATH